MLKIKIPFRHLLSQLLVTVCFTFLFTACSNDHNEPLRLGTNVWPGYEPLHLADSLKYIKRNEIRLVEYSSASQVSDAFRNGLIDAAALTLDDVLVLAQYGFQPEIVLVTDISNGGDVIMARSELSDITALKGHRVGVESTALGAYILVRALQQANMHIDDITLVPIDVDEHKTAYQSQLVDAVVTFEPVRSQLHNMGAHEVFSSREIPGEIVDVLVVRRDYLEKNDQLVRILITAWYRTLDYMSEHHAEAMQKISERLHITADETIASYDGLKLPDKTENRRLLISNKDTDATLITTAQSLMSVMTEQKLIQRPVDTKSLFHYIQNNPTLQK